MHATRKARTVPAPVLFTIGYEGRTVREVVERLVSSKVRLLVDVRENAISRKAGFSKKRLEATLAAAGIQYRHEPNLGNPRNNREAFRNGAVAKGKRRYLKHLNNGSRAAFNEVISLALTQRVALLCFEREQAKCHRSCIVEQAQAEQDSLLVTEL